MVTPSAVYTVSQVAGYLKTVLEADPQLADLWISAEVSNHRQYSSGHHYFSIRDADSSLACVMFRGGRGGEFLEDGTQVLAHGRISLYPARGDLQFYVDVVRPEGAGALQVAFERLKRRLEQEGLFDPDRKRALPLFPLRIAVVTSPTGAALQDILNVLRRRYPLAEVALAPTLVQGDAAAEYIASALAAVNAAPGIDVVILARGGGSLEDLWPFNEETVARAVFASRVPVISAVGHETDVTISDLVADVRAPTPSAGAELATPDIAELAVAIREHGRVLRRAIVRQLQDRRTNLSLAADRLHARAPDTGTPRLRIDQLLRAAQLAAHRTLEARRARLTGIELQLKALGPAGILARGYAVVRKAPDGPVIASARAASPGDLLRITFADGEIGAETLATAPASPEGATPRPESAATGGEKYNTGTGRRGDRPSPTDSLPAPRSS